VCDSCPCDPCPCCPPPTTVRATITAGAFDCPPDVYPGTVTLPDGTEMPVEFVVEAEESDQPLVVS
jgi:hypothetical protein